MIQETPQADLFKQQMRESLRQETLNSRAVTIAKHDHVYTCGDNDELVYFIESGQIKLLMLSPGRERMPVSHPCSGRYFWRVMPVRLGRAAGNRDCHGRNGPKQIPCSNFFARLDSDSLFEGFVQYLSVRIADQQQIIANLVTVDSEQRLGQTLLQLARTMGKKDPRSIRIAENHDMKELSEMVGATRSRISLFMQRFYNLGLIETNADHFLIIKEKKLVAYLASDRLDRRHGKIEYKPQATKMTKKCGIN